MNVREDRELDLFEADSLSPIEFQKKVIESNRPVLVVIVAGWWSKSDMLYSMLRKLKEDTDDEVLFIKSDLISNSDLAVTYEIYNIPTFLLFKGGQLVDSVSGMPPYEVLRGKLISLLFKDKRIDQ